MVSSRVRCDWEVKVQCTPVQALRLCTGRTARNRSRGIALLFHDHDTRRGWGLSVTPRPLFTTGKDPVPIVQEVGWAQGPVWIGAEKISPSTGIRSPDRPARSQSLYRLSYRAHMLTEKCAGIVRCSCYILRSILVLTPNGNFWVVPLLHSVSDIYIQFAGHREHSALPLQISIGECLIGK